MTADTSTLLERLLALVGLFDRGSLDLPDGVLTHGTVYRLNGLAYDEALGRPGDPLARLVGRGPGGYRFLFKAIRFAIPDARLAIGALERSSLEEGCQLAGRGELSGMPRGSHAPLAAPFGVVFRFDDAGRLTAIDVELADDDLARIQAARHVETPA